MNHLVLVKQSLRAALLFSCGTLFLIGCNHQRPVQQQVPSESHEVPSQEIIKPGFYANGPEYDEIASVLSQANAFISLDAHQGIECFDATQRSWRKLDSIDDVEGYLANVNDKSLVRISTGMASWDKEAEYVDKIIEMSKTLGYTTVVITNDHSSALIVDRVISN